MSGDKQQKNSAKTNKCYIKSNKRNGNEIEAYQMQKWKWKPGYSTFQIEDHIVPSIAEEEQKFLVFSRNFQECLTHLEKIIKDELNNLESSAVRP